MNYIYANVIQWCNQLSCNLFVISSIVDIVFNLNVKKSKYVLSKMKQHLRNYFDVKYICHFPKVQYIENILSRVILENFLSRVIYWKCFSQHEKVGIWFPCLHSMLEVSYSSYFVNNNLVGINMMCVI